MENIKIDMWYGNTIPEIDDISINFGCNGYTGNCYINGKAVGDYNTWDSTAIEKAFPQLTINWD